MAVAIFVEQQRISAQSLEAARFWMWRAGFGMLLGTSIALLEFAYYYPLVSTPDRLGAGSLLSSLLTWCGEGVLLALTVGVFERREAPRLLNARQLALAVVVGAVLGVLAWQAFVQLVLRAQFGIWLFRDHLGQSIDGPGIALYHSWLTLFFGGLAAAVHLSRQRHARVLAVLRAAELDRETTQRRLAEARLAALEAKIDPDFLFKTLAKLEQLYEADPPGADRLLEELIAFLRSALADIRLQSRKEET